MIKILVSYEGYAEDHGRNVFLVNSKKNKLN